MGMNLGGGYAAGGGAEALQDLWQLLAQQEDLTQRRKLEGERLKLDARRVENESAWRHEEMQSRAEGRKDAAQARAQTGAAKLAGNLSIGQDLSPDTSAALTAGDLGDTVKAPTLGSRNLSGTLRMLTSTPNPGKGETYLGTAPQQQDRRQDDEFERQVTLAPPSLRGKLQMLRPLDREKRGAGITEILREEAKPDTKPLYRIGRDGKPTHMGDLPANAATVNEPAPAGASHGSYYNTTQGTDGSGKPVMIRTNVDTGDVSVLPMPDGVNFSKREQPLTQDQTNLGLYANRVEQSDPILSNLAPSIAGMNVLSYEAQTRANPKLQSAEMQSYMQAARNFINAVLRRESGAVISKQEFSEARKQYLPVPGDAEQTVRQKAENRRIVLENYKRGAGPAYKPMSATTPPGGGGFQVVGVRDK